MRSYFLLERKLLKNILRRQLKSKIKIPYIKTNKKKHTLFRKKKLKTLRIKGVKKKKKKYYFKTYKKSLKNLKNKKNIKIKKRIFKRKLNLLILIINYVFICLNDLNLKKCLV